MARANSTQQAPAGTTPQAPAKPPPADPATFPPRPQAGGVHRPLDVIRAKLVQSSERLEQVLPRHLSPGRVIQVVSTMVYRTPRLQECEPNSIVAAVIQASSLGLDLSPTTGEAYLVPVWNSKIPPRGAYECQFRPGYRGLTKLVIQAGGAVDIWADVVYMNDEFWYQRTPGLEFLHRPCLDGDRGHVTHVYAVAELPTGKYRLDCMSVEDVERIHARSEGFKSARNTGKAEAGPWATDWNEMAKKSVIRRLAKSLRMSPELADALEADNREYEVEAAMAQGQVPMLPRRGLAALGGRLGIEDRALPPQGTRTYTEADDPVPDPDPLPAEEATQEPPGDAELGPDEGWPEGRE